MDQLVDALNAFCKCPQQARPEMPQAWLDSFLEATGKHLQQAMPVSAPDLAAVASSSGVVLQHLLLLALAVPYLPTPPSRAWHSQFVLAAAGMLPDFSAEQAAQLLIALGRWKQTLGQHMASGSCSAESAAAAHASFNSCLPLYDSLMLAASRAGGIAPPSTGTANGGLSLRTVQALPAALAELQWPSDEEVVQAVQGYIAAFRQMTLRSAGKIEAMLQTRSKQLQQLQEAESSGAGSSSSSSSKKQRNGSSRSRQQQQPAGSFKQELLQLQEDVTGLQQAVDQAAAMVHGLDEMTDAWQQLLQPLAADDHTGDAAAAAGIAVGSSGNGAGFCRGGEDRLVGGLDVDALMAGMLQAAGMPQPTAVAAAGAPSAFFEGSGGSMNADVTSELDDLLGGLALMSEMQGAGWELLADDDDEGEEGGGGGEEYIDTVAEDVV
jgi:hypothetical protein